MASKSCSFYAINYIISMIIIRYKDLGNADFGWLNARYHFSFSNYYNPERMGFGKIRVINDDIVQPGRGFPKHPHDNMEIITYVRQGAISHEDSAGNKGRTGAGDIQVMSAGSGITHSEYNHENVETRLYQIWIEPRERNVKPRWDAYEFPKEPVRNALPLLVSGDGKAPLTINADAQISGGIIAENCELTHPINGQAYVLISQGNVEIDGSKLSMGDAVEVTNQKALSIITRDKPAEVLIIDV